MLRMHWSYAPHVWGQPPVSARSVWWDSLVVRAMDSLLFGGCVWFTVKGFMIHIVLCSWERGVGGFGILTGHFGSKNVVALVS